MKYTYLQKLNSEKCLNDVQFKLKQGETIGILGESGSGKSTIALAIMGLLPKEVIILGSILWQREIKQIDLIKSSVKERRNLRGQDMAMIFQEPMSSLNPVLKCGEQIEEALRTHQKLSRKEAKRETLILLEKV